MNDKTRNDFASYGLEIPKRSALLVLYKGTDIVYEKSPYAQGRVLTAGQFVNGLTSSNLYVYLLLQTLSFMVSLITYGMMDMLIIMLVREGHHIERRKVH